MKKRLLALLLAVSMVLYTPINVQASEETAIEATEQQLEEASSDEEQKSEEEMGTKEENQRIDQETNENDDKDNPEVIDDTKEDPEEVNEDDSLSGLDNLEEVTDEVDLKDLLEDSELEELLQVDDEEQDLLKSMGVEAVLLATPAKKEEWQLSKTVTATLEKGTLTISGKGGMPNYTDKKLAPWIEKDAKKVKLIAKNYTKLVIEDGITSVGDYAFIFSQVKNIEFPKSLKSIGKWSFFGSSLDTIKFNGNIPSVGDSAFGGLTIVAYYPAENKTYTLAKRNALDSRFYFVNWKELSDSKAVDKHCGENATWKYDANSKTLSISGSGDMYDYNGSDNLPPWFEYRNNISKLNISGVKSIGAYAFRNCKIENITISSTVKTINASAFEYSKISGIATDGFIANVEVISDRAFSNADLGTLGKSQSNSLNLSGAKNIGNNAFYNLVNKSGYSFTIKLGEIT